jgi:hypothetical protein
MCGFHAPRSRASETTKALGLSAEGFDVLSG